ncbi:MAG: tRNA (guanosine(37)-N1)-methyltransferase TrmD [Verrucomicrobia bacterium]|nr:MAG: tRNA (guanosine(37)-N1)-methyltransferase TrmD [Verrucomicrobiota bacterium]
MKIRILTLFPAMCEGVLSHTILGRARELGLADVQALDLRQWAAGKHRITDEPPYGGGPGMVMKVEPYANALAELKGPRTRAILMSAQGRPFKQPIARSYAEQEKDLILLCGHYEGVDQRVADHLVDDEICIGDYILTNGVLPALVFADAVVRLIPGVLGDSQSALSDSFSEQLLDHPHYTRPEEFRGWKVPAVLLSGNHKKIQEWRLESARALTRKRRPDLLERSF